MLSCPVISFQPALTSPTRYLSGQSDVAVIGGIGAYAQRVHRGEGEALDVRGYQEHGEALVLFAGVGICARGQPNVVGIVGEAGPHFLAVDNPVIPIAFSLCCVRPATGRIPAVGSE